MVNRVLGGALVFGLAAMAMAQLPAEVAGAMAISEAQLGLEAPNARLMKRAGKVERVYGAPFSYGSSPVDSAQAFVSRYRELFTPDQGVFKLEGTQDVMNGKFTAVYFNQTHDGYPVDGGHLTILVRSEREYPAVLASSMVRLTSGSLGSPAISAKRAVAAVRKANSALREFSSPELVSYPGEERAHLAWRFIGDSARLVGQQKFQVFVDAKTGQILEWRNQIYQVDVSGSVQGRSTPGLKPDQPNNPSTSGPIQGVRVNITGGNTTYSDSLGNYTIANAGSSAVTVNTTLIGRWVTVGNSAVGGTVLSLSQSATPPGPANFTYNSAPTEFNTSQMNAFRHTEAIHNFAKSILPTYPGIDIVLPANVNIASTCNANFNGSAINFFAAGGGCPNTAYSSVVWHEYGHFIINRGHPSPTGDYHEGIADVTACLMGDTPWLGEDFFGQGTGPLRSAINNINYPYVGGVHTGGQVISGAFWLTLLELDVTEGHTNALALSRSWYLNSILLRPAGITPAITVDVLTLDDDDGNLHNGTPHYNEIASGFGRKNLTAPQLDWVNIEPLSLPAFLVKGNNPAREEIIRTFDYRMSISNNAGTLDPTSVKVWVSLNGGAYASTPLSGAGGNLYRGAVRTPLCGVGARYYVEAKDTQGRSTYFPRGGPAEPLQMVGGADLRPFFEDTFSTNLGWTVVNTDLASGAWVRADPIGTFLNGAPANPEDDANDPGTFCFFTGQGTVGGAVGTQDVDGGPTVLLSPTLNLSGFNAVIDYRRWYFNDDGDDPFTVEISNNGGASWVLVETVMFTGTQNQWVPRTIVVSNYVTPTANVVVRFSATDNPNNSITEAGVDHFVVRQIVCD